MRLPTFYEQNLIPNWGNVYSTGRIGLIRFIPQTCHYFPYAVNAHSVDGSTIAAGRHITLIGICTLIGYEEHFLIKQNSVEPFVSVIRIFTMFA